MAVLIEDLSVVAGGYVLRFRAPARDDFDDMRLRIKALSAHEAQWQPGAFGGRGGWWLSRAAFDKVGPLFRNYREVRQRLEAEARGGSSPPLIPLQVEQAFSVLHLRPTAPPWVVQAVYRVLAKRSHPDAGGSHEAMKALNLAYEQALAWAERHAPAA